MSQPEYHVLIIATTLKPQGLELLEPVARLTRLPDYATPETLVPLMGDVDAVLSRSGSFSRVVIEAAPKLKIISRHGVGCDNIDVAACNEHGVIISTSGDANSEAVSEHTMALLLSAARMLPFADRSIRAGIWDRGSVRSVELRGKTLGLVGLGRIGSRVAHHAQGFDMRVLAYDPYATPEMARAAHAELTDLESVLRQADFVSLHAPLTPETRHLIGAAELALMKPDAILVNTSRGGLVDEAALCEALAEKRIAGAALDVFEQEPLEPDSPLRSLDNVVLAPHLGGTTEEALVRLSVRAAENIMRVLQDERPAGVHNPEVLETTTRVRWKD
ncbi:MAG: hydroxyacid dehydrogenase [Anaerolineae bacterium]|nr:hydroxyacid dehydrogenase [Anaerolineae bacterium]